MIATVVKRVRKMYESEKRKEARLKKEKDPMQKSFEKEKLEDRIDRSGNSPANEEDGKDSRYKHETYVAVLRFNHNRVCMDACT